jgi:hypothetical protein
MQEQPTTRPGVGFEPAGAPRAPGPEVAGHVSRLSGNGAALPQAARDYFEPRIGFDLRHVRIHADETAARSAQALNARAYTLDRHIVFGPGEYSPSTESGRRLLGHELVHVVQQGGVAPVRRESVGAPASRGGESIQRQTIKEQTDQPTIARLTPAMCASGADCSEEDGAGGPTGKYLLTVYADKEGPFLLIPLTSKVGHSWIRLVDTTGHIWTYGFWPQQGFDSSDIHKDVDGCVHHPDHAHQPTSEQTFELTAEQFASAKNMAQSICITQPAYNLFRMQCTSFVRKILDAAGKGPGGGFGLIWDSPNALDAWMRTNALLIGINVTAASTGPGGPGVSFDAIYQHQFYSLLGNKLRLTGFARTELGSPVKSLSAGPGVELTPQRIYLPSIYLTGGGVLGGLGGPSDKFGAGVTASAGLGFRIDQLATVGVEYNVVKDLVNRDPELQRLMITARINLF